jgi:arylsulfatase A-like enzyme
MGRFYAFLIMKKNNLRLLFFCAIILFPILVLAQSKPNVIVIYTDDQGAIDLGSYGATDLYTPHLDALAKLGTRFTQAYVAAPVCAPSRASLLTGKYPQRAGVSGNTSAAVGSHGLRSAQFTMAELFKANGYRTAHIGKWHLGMSEESSPNNQGFDYSFGHLRGCIDNYSHFFYWEGPNIHDLHENGKEVFYEGQYFPDLASNKALEYIESHSNEPFFMFYAINMPHYPYQPTQKWRNYYKDYSQPRADYAAFISTIDERIGWLMSKLKDLKLLENTIIVYQADNGHSTETRAFSGGGNAGPYRGAKSSLFEGGIRLPTIISWKDNLPEARVNDEFLMNLDWMPTLATLCGLNQLPDDLDGLDLSRIIKEPGTASLREKAFWKYGTQWAVRKGNWKLMGNPKDTSKKGVLDMENDALFLANLDHDVTEMTNLAHQYPEKVKELSNEFIQWEYGEPDDIPKKAQVKEHKGYKKEIKAIKPLHKLYNNLEVLLDGKRGIKDFSSGQWIGQEGKSLEFLIDLRKEEYVNNISIGYLYNDKSWILRPQTIDWSISDDGMKFTKSVQQNINTPFSENKWSLEEYTINLEVKTRFIKLNITPVLDCPENLACSGNSGWVFLDEIVIN